MTASNTDIIRLMSIVFACFSMLDRMAFAEITTAVCIAVAIVTYTVSKIAICGSSGRA
jgi:hypothetical protein